VRIPLKGPVLALSAYGDLSYRGFSDLDILIQEHDIARAVATLAELGFRCKCHNAWLKPYLSFGHELDFICDNGDVFVDLQWRLSKRWLFIACQLIRTMESSTKHDDLRIPSVATVRRGYDPVPMHAWLPPLLESLDMDNGCSGFLAPVRHPIGRDTTPQAGTSARRNAPAHPRAVAGARDRRRTSARIAAATYSLDRLRFRGSADLLPNAFSIQRPWVPVDHSARSGLLYSTGLHGRGCETGCPCPVLSSRMVPIYSDDGRNSMRVGCCDDRSGCGQIDPHCS